MVLIVEVVIPRDKLWGFRGVPSVPGSRNRVKGSQVDVVGRMSWLSVDVALSPREPSVPKGRACPSSTHMFSSIGVRSRLIDIDIGVKLRK